MSKQEPYNPLQKKNLAESIVRAVLNQPAEPLAKTNELGGAGVYIIYYSGDSELYGPVAEKNRDGKWEQPIYIGKAIPKGGRKGGFADDLSAARGTALRDRLGQHHASINEARNLEIADFSFRALVVDEIFIPLGENMLIERYRPVWNLVIDGFGNKDPGRRRKDQYRSPWDVIHQGRRFAEKLGENPIPAHEYASSLQAFYTSGKVTKPKKPANVTAMEQPGDEADETGIEGS
ncbi:Restriction endonuclease, type II, Eco29kI [Burkholderia sp. MR1]|nr:Restriction endonuclease, type II, Eco29kI [Burkholderia sp. MR1]